MLLAQQRAYLATWAQARRRLHQNLLPAPVIFPVYPSLVRWEWNYTNPARWNAYISLDGGVSYIFNGFVNGSGRQYAPDGNEFIFIVGVDADGKEITHRSNSIRPEDATSLTISSLDEVEGLLVEYRADAASLGSYGPVTNWYSAAGYSPLILSYYNDGSTPVFVQDVFGVGRDAVYFDGGKFTADVVWTFSGMTSVFVGNVDAFNLQHPFPRWIGLARYEFNEEDWASADTWIAACYDSAGGNFVADRNGARPLAVPLDSTKNYIILTRTGGGVVSAWVRPFGEATVTASGSTTTSPLVLDTLLVGGNMEPQNLTGNIAHIGLWDHAISDVEAAALMNFLGSIYE
jgi:hypothetical protein